MRCLCVCVRWEFNVWCWCCFVLNSHDLVNMEIWEFRHCDRVVDIKWMKCVDTKNLIRTQIGLPYYRIRWRDTWMENGNHGEMKERNENPSMIGAMNWKAYCSTDYWIWLKLSEEIIFVRACACVCRRVPGLRFIHAAVAVVLNTSHYGASGRGKTHNVKNGVKSAEVEKK